MRKKLVFCLFVFLAFSFTACSRADYYEDGYKSGYREGYNAGQEEAELSAEEILDSACHDVKDDWYLSLDKVGSKMMDPEDFVREIKDGYWSELELEQWYIDLYNTYLEEVSKVY